jgi:hypothetical protein
MRARVWSALLLPLCISGLSCRGVAAPAETEPIWTSVDTGIEVFDTEHRHGPALYRVQLTQPTGHGQRVLQIRFRGPLEGAKVDANGTGPHQVVRLLEDKRIGGDTVTVPLGNTDLSAVELQVHHHHGPTPLPVDVRIGTTKERRAQSTDAGQAAPWI